MTKASWKTRQKDEDKDSDYSAVIWRKNILFRNFYLYKWYQESSGPKLRMTKVSWKNRQKDEFKDQNWNGITIGMFYQKMDCSAVIWRKKLRYSVKYYLYKMVSGILWYEEKDHKNKLKNRQKSEFKNHSSPDSFTDVKSCPGQITDPRGKKICRFFT